MLLILLRPAMLFLKDKSAPDFVNQVFVPFMKMVGDVLSISQPLDPTVSFRLQEGDRLPVSAFAGDRLGGLLPVGLTQYERRGIAAQIPTWIIDKRTQVDFLLPSFITSFLTPLLLFQCNYCSLVCPHAAIRPFTKPAASAAADVASGRAPAHYAFKKMLPGKELLPGPGGSASTDLVYSIQVSPYDCTGCGLCAAYCADKALEMKPIRSVADQADEMWKYVRSLPETVCSSACSVPALWMGPCHYFSFLLAFTQIC